MTELSIKDRARIELAVHRVDTSLQWRIPRARRRQVREELKANLTEAAQRVGGEEAVRQLGDLRALARSYADVYRGRWDYWAGWWAMFITYVVVQVLSVVISLAFSAGVVAGGGHPASYAVWSGFGPFAGSASSHTFTVALGSPAHLILMGIAFVIGAAHRQILRR
jgi:hypothetical protein